MNQRTHGYKKKIARKMMTPAMIKSHRPIFANSLWDERKDAIADRVKRQQGAAHQRALKRAKLKVSV